MPETNVQSPAAERSPKGRQDLPGCIKYILLLFLLLLLFAEWGAGEYNRLAEGASLTWIILLIKLALIAGLIGLIKVQRNLKCQITDPSSGECVAEQTDTVGGFQYITVKGTASGSVFGHYTLAISGPYAYTVNYPPGGGSVPVVGGVLGSINTTGLDHGSYTITLTVYPAGAGTPKVCTKTFTLLKVAVYITTVATVPAVPSCFDETAELVLGAHIVSVGGTMNLTGSAYVYECSGRKVASYELRYARVAAPGPGPSQPHTDDPIPAAWPVGNELALPLVYGPTDYWPWTEVGEMPTNLINDWGTIHVGAPSPGGMDYPVLVPTSWDSHGATGTPGGGRYYLLLITQDTASHTYYDLQRTWIDNWAVVCQIV